MFVKVHADVFRQIMVVAFKLGMTTGEYAFIFLGLFEGAPGGDYTWKRNDEYDEVNKYK